METNGDLLLQSLAVPENTGLLQMPITVTATPVDRTKLTIECDSSDIVVVSGKRMWTCCTCSESFGSDDSINEHLFTQHKMLKSPTASSSGKYDGDAFLRLKSVHQQYSSGFSCMLKKLRQAALLFKDLCAVREQAILEEMLSALDSVCAQAEGVPKTSQKGQSTLSKRSSSGRQHAAQKRDPDFVYDDEMADSSSLHLPAAGLDLFSSVESAADTEISVLAAAAAASCPPSHTFTHSSVNREIEPCAIGGTKGTGRHLDAMELFRLFLSGEQPLEEIPKGRKENVYFVVSNAYNSQRRANGQKAMYVDDCGAWSGAGSCKKNFYLIQGEKLREIYFKNGQYYNVIKGQRVLMDPQPSENELFITRRYYAIHKDSPNYRRRIANVIYHPPHLQLRDVYIAEYVGEPPSVKQPHQNSKKNSVPYVRTAASTKRRMEELLATSSEKPHKLYQKMLQEDSLNPPRSSQQIRTAKYNKSRKNSLTIVRSRSNTILLK